MIPRDAWVEIVNASGLWDEAQAYHGHDLLDGIVEGAQAAPLEHTFLLLCKHTGVRTWADIEPVLARMRTIEGFEGLRLPDSRIADLVDREMEDRGGLIKGICDHTSIRRGTYSDSWGTPDHILQIVRDLHGEITHDLASNDEAQKTVRAGKHWTVQDPCPNDPDVGAGAVVWCNPPGPCKRVAEFWDVWQRCVQRGARGGFLIFKQDHWRQLLAPFRPMISIVLRKRLRFVGAPSGASFPSTLVLSCGERGTEHLQQFGHVTLWLP